MYHVRRNLILEASEYLHTVTFAQRVQKGCNANQQTLRLFCEAWGSLALSWE